MTELRIVVEGETEQEFIKRVLAPHLKQLGVYATSSKVLTSIGHDGRQHKGGGDWMKWLAHIRKHCRDQRPHLRITTMFDLYGLPKNFPALDQHARVSDTAARATLLEEALEAEIGDSRFLPYLQRHEFEALVLAALPALEDVLVEHRDRAGLRKLVSDLGDTAPEDVNDGTTTAPSKRLQDFIPSYNPRNRRKGEGKSVYGPLATEAIGLEVLRAKCPRFHAWVTKLEALAETPG